MVPVLCVVGPTASGKSKAAIALAKRFNGEIISADSMQVYSNLTITTAAIPPSEQEGIPHHLLGIADAVTTDFTVLSFRDAARKLIQEITARGKLPILCGGTMYYVDACIWPFGQDEASPNDLRDPNLDPIAPNDRKKAHVKTVPRWSVMMPALYDVVFVYVDAQPEVLDKRVDDRADLMMKSGMMDELHALYPFLSDRDVVKGLQGIMQSIGLKEFLPALQVGRDHDRYAALVAQGVNDLKLHTRQYVRRQRKWFTNKTMAHVPAPPAIRLDTTNGVDVSPIIERIDSFINAARAGCSFVTITDIPPTVTDTEHFTCKKCELKLIGKRAWDVHVKSKRHRRHKVKPTKV